MLTRATRSTDQMIVAPTFPFTSPPPVEIFAVDDRSAQVVWRHIGDGTVIARVDDRVEPLGDAHGVGVGTIHELMPDHGHEITISVDDRSKASLTVRTAPSLGPAPTIKVATISDLHLGEQGFGLVKKMNEPRDTPEGYPFRCAAAAIAEALEWGAELLVIKGDITDSGRPDEWAAFHRLLDPIPIPVLAIPGNHDTRGQRRSLDATVQLQQRGLFPSPVHVVDDAPVRDRKSVV